MSTPPPPLSAGGALNLLQNFQKGGAWQDLNIERGVAGKEGGNFFQRVAIFTKKKKQTKIEIFNDKKIYKQKYFSLS